MAIRHDPLDRDRWARLRFSIIGHLLAAPPQTGELRPGQVGAEVHRQSRETHSFEVDHVGGLLHLDFHHGSRKVLTRAGAWVKPMALAILDDRSRLACHVQWYLNETTEPLVHGLSQALQRRGLPRALMTDNGAAMVAEEFASGLHILGIVHQTTLPYSPQQNGKQEVFWGRLEGLLMAMLEGVSELTWNCSTPRRKPGSSTSTSAQSTAKSMQHPSHATSKVPR
jgi:putative transposase